MGLVPLSVLLSSASRLNRHGLSIHLRNLVGPGLAKLRTAGRKLLLGTLIHDSHVFDDHAISDSLDANSTSFSDFKVQEERLVAPNLDIVAIFGMELVNDVRADETGSRELLEMSNNGFYRLRVDGMRVRGVEVVEVAFHVLLVLCDLRSQFFASLSVPLAAHDLTDNLNLNSYQSSREIGIISRLDGVTALANDFRLKLITRAGCPSALGPGAVVVDKRISQEV